MSPAFGVFLEIVVVDAWEQVEEGVETAVECAPQLGYRAIDGVQRHPCRLAARQLQPRLVGRHETAFRNQPDAIDQCVPRHAFHYTPRTPRGRSTMSVPLVTLAEIRAAADRIRGLADRTPLLGPYPGTGQGASLALKAEQLQPMGAFKIRDRPWRSWRSGWACAPSS